MEDYADSGQKRSTKKDTRCPKKSDAEIETVNHGPGKLIAQNQRAETERKAGVRKLKIIIGILPTAFGSSTV